tara:strand:+ start:159 stop:323 length:165 start_codon:yes stop_codon:yes gene_type:complete
MKTELQSLYICLTNELKLQKEKGDDLYKIKIRKERIETLRESIKIEIKRIKKFK